MASAEAEEKAAVSTASGATPVRRPYKGSCHCGATRYIVWLALPLDKPERGKAPNRAFAYRCNCTPCHKMGYLHVRLADATSDFALLAPLDPLHDLTDYLCGDRNLHWLFCRTCGVRCMIFCGEGEVADVPDPEDAAKTVQAWRPRKEVWKEYGRTPGEPPCYLSVNALTLDAGQEGLDLREWVDEKRLFYVDCLEFKAQQSYDRPHPGGTY